MTHHFPTLGLGFHFSLKPEQEISTRDVFCDQSSFHEAPTCIALLITFRSNFDIVEG